MTAAHAVDKRGRRVLTPEGVALRFEIALAGDRLGALLIDLVLMALATFAILVPAVLASGHELGEGWTAAVGIIASFFVRNFYFVFFEYRWQGVTPGKRRMRIRVIDREGGPLTPSAIFARNLTRDLEVFLPLGALFAPQQILPELPGWATVVASVWIVILGLLPLFNRDRLRVGDLIAGTMVVASPRVQLEAELARAGSTESAALRETRQRDDGDLLFTPAQLDLYGEYELGVLEDVLRRADQHAMALVAAKIQRKIGWRSTGNALDASAFLSAFYAAQRARLEQRRVLGKRRKDKHG